MVVPENVILGMGFVKFSWRHNDATAHRNPLLLVREKKKKNTPILPPRRLPHQGSGAIMAMAMASSAVAVRALRRLRTVSLAAALSPSSSKVPALSPPEAYSVRPARPSHRLWLRH
ncbi:unnamed protein product [Urochloa humidicola]